METLSNNGFDIAVALFLFLGALIGLAVGFVRGGLFVLSWLGAGAATIYGFPIARPIARSYIENTLFADIAGGAAVFIGALIIFFLLSSVLGGWVRNSRLNALDRSLGMMAGLLTCALALSGAYMLAEQQWSPDKQPKWMKDARSIPLIRAGAYMVNDLLPAEIRVTTRQATNSATEGTRDLIERKKAFDRLIQPAAKDGTAPDRTGYDNKERQSLDRLIQGKQ